MGLSWARHPEPTITAPDRRPGTLHGGSFPRETGGGAGPSVLLMVSTAPARLAEVGPLGAPNPSAGQWLSPVWGTHCSEARPWRSFSGRAP
eukprot:scaffold65191_cov36-Phaeocystis_antarctica.AAC.1